MRQTCGKIERSSISRASTLAFVMLLALYRPPLAQEQVARGHELSAPDAVKVRELLFPLKGIPSDHTIPILDLHYFVEVRISGPWLDSLTYISIAWNYQFNVHAIVKTVGKVPLKVQLARLRDDYPYKSLEELVSLVALTEYSTNEKKHPELKVAAREFERLEISIAPDDELMLDTTDYDLLAESFGANRIMLHIRGPVTVGKSNSNPVLRWIDDVRRIVMSQR